MSLCLSLLSKTKDLTESSGVLVSSYDLIIEKIDSIVARINTAVRESDALFRQSLKFQSIVEQNLSYAVALPTKFCLLYTSVTLHKLCESFNSCWYSNGCV